jgi:AcrR family transcriptional regulator
MSDEQTTRLGRPRSTQADQAILSAAREMLAEGGLDRLTVEGTAQRAGVAKTTVYRRYPTKLDLAVAAVAALVADPPFAGSVADTTAQGMQTFETMMGSPGSQAAYLAVAAAAAADPAVHERFSSTVLSEVRKSFEASVDAAKRSGEAADNPDVDFIYDVTIGALMHRQIIRKLPLNGDFQDRFTALMKFLYEMPG